MNMLNEGLKDPLAAARVLEQLQQQALDLGLKTEISGDMAAFAQEKLKNENAPVSPMFDPTVNEFGENKAFWLRASNRDNVTICIQGFRVDYVDTNLADWSLTWMLGLYHKRAEAIVPRYTRPPESSRSYTASGTIVYQGEFWIHKSYRRFRLLELFPRMGMILSLLKWHPDFIWALVSERAATRAQTVRAGYATCERGIFRWEWEPRGADPTEWLALSSRADLEYLINEMDSRTPAVELGPGPDG